MKFKIEIIGGAVVARSIERIFKVTESNAMKALNAYIVKLHRHIVTQKLSGQVLKVQTGALRSGIMPQRAKRRGNILLAALSSNVAYWHIHEMGGRTPPHVILPRNKQALAFEIGGKMVVVKRVNHPGSVIPARPYIRPSIEETSPIFTQLLLKAIEKSMKA